MSKLFQEALPFRNLPATSKMSAKQNVESKVSANKVVVFSKTYCPYCTKTKSLLNSLGVDYSLVELDNVNDGDDQQDALQEITGANFYCFECIGVSMSSITLIFMFAYRPALGAQHVHRRQVRGRQLGHPGPPQERQARASAQGGRRHRVNRQALSHAHDHLNKRQLHVIVPCVFPWNLHLSW